MLTEAWAAYKAYSTAKRWVPYLVGGVGGLLLAAALIGVPAYFMVSGARETAAAVAVERDTYKTSAETQADAVRARDRTISRLNAQAILILNDWRDTRADAAEVAAKTKDMAAQVEAINRDMTEKANAQDADPVGLALDGLGQLCRSQQARAGTTAGGC